MMTSSNGNISALLVLCEGSPVNSPHKGQWRVALMFSLIRAWTNGWANNRDTGDLRRYRADCDVSVISTVVSALLQLWTDCVLKIVILYTKKVARQNEKSRGIVTSSVHMSKNFGKFLKSFIERTCISHGKFWYWKISVSRCMIRWQRTGQGWF